MSDIPTETTAVVTDHRDIGFTVVATLIGEHAVDFKVYEITSHESEDEVRWQMRDSVSSPNPVETLEEAEVYLEGAVKWDGCSNLTFAPDSGGYIHFCGARQAARTGVLLARLYEQAHGLMPKTADFSIATATATW